MSTEPLLDDARLCELLKDTLGLCFDVKRGYFRFCPPSQTVNAVLLDDQLLVLLSTTLGRRPDLVHPGRLRPRRLKRLLQTLKAICACGDDLAVNELRNFVASRLIRQPGSDVTSTELRVAYEAMPRTGSMLSSREIHRYLPIFIKDKFCLTKLHEILRPDPSGHPTERNGWRGLKLTDGLMGTDSTDFTLTNLATSQGKD